MQKYISGEDEKRIGAEIALTFLQLARDEFGMFFNCKHVKEKQLCYRKLAIRENMATIFRNIKNKMRTQGIEKEYDRILERIGDNADDIDKEIEEMHRVIRTNIAQRMSYDCQEAFMYSIMTYLFLYACKCSIGAFFNNTKQTEILENTLTLLNEIPIEYGWDAWKPLDDILSKEITEKAITKIVDTVIINRIKHNNLTKINYGKKVLDKGCV